MDGGWPANAVRAEVVGTERRNIQGQSHSLARDPSITEILSTILSRARKHVSNCCRDYYRTGSREGQGLLGVLLRELRNRTALQRLEAQAAGQTGASPGPTGGTTKEGASGS